VKGGYKKRKDRCKNTNTGIRTLAIPENKKKKNEYKRANKKKEKKRG